MMPDERRLSFRKPLERLAYIGLPFNNGGIVLDVSEGGVGFHAIAPVEVDGPIHFRFAVDSSRRIKAVGELAWKDETGKTGGLRFTELPDGVREYICDWLGQTKAKALEVPAAESGVAANAALDSQAYLAPAGDVTIVESVVDAEAAPGGKIEYASALNVPADVLAADAEAASGESIGWTPSWDIPETEAESEPEPELHGATNSPLLYNLKPPVYSAPSYDLSMFTAASKSKAGAGMAAPREPFITRHPIAALVLTIFLASVVGSGIFAYVSTSQAGDIIYYLGEKAWEGLHPQSAPKSPAPQVSSATDSSKASQR